MTDLRSLQTPSPSRKHLWLGLAIVVVALVALVVEFSTLPQLRFWENFNSPYQRGVSAYRKGDYHAAIRHFTHAIEQQPRFYPAYHDRGLSYRAIQNDDLALVDFEAASKIAPKEYLPWYNRGRIYASRQDHRRAIDHLNEALRLNPGFSPALIDRALERNLAGESEAALADANEAIRIDPREASAFTVRAAIFERGRRYANAKSDYRKSIELDSTNAMNMNNFAWMLATCPQADSRDGPTAVQYATKACDLTNWKIASVVDTLAAAHAETGDFEKAAEWQAKCISYGDFSLVEMKGARDRLTLYQSRTPFRTEEK
jgi:tetratricopeptide (TPR) repeat protein